MATSTPSATPLPLRFAQVLGITSSAYFADCLTATSHSTIPLLLASPASLLLHQFRLLHEQGRYSDTIALWCESILLVGLGAYFRPTIANGFFSRAASAMSRGFLGAGLITSATALFTALAMGKITEELLFRANQQDQARAAGDVHGAPRLTEHELEEGWDETEIRPERTKVGEKMSWREIWQVAFGGKEQRESLSVHQLVDVYGTMNLVRASMALLAAEHAVFGVVSVAEL